MSKDFCILKIKLGKATIFIPSDDIRLVLNIIKTANSNNLVIEKYLVYLFDMISKSDVKSRVELLEIMPCSETLSEEIKITTNCILHLK
ncbi:hypothetical protein [Clostridium sp.]|uniref:hypothetical protein n=1 Tax=Clostridium sp. TaxID=1506 RepID=UPI003217213D